MEFMHRNWMVLGIFGVWKIIVYQAVATFVVGDVLMDVAVLVVVVELIPVFLEFDTFRMLVVELQVVAFSL